MTDKPSSLSGLLNLDTPGGVPPATESKAVAVPSESLVAAKLRALSQGASGGFIGMERVSTESLGFSIPELRLIHSIRTADDVGKPGWYKVGRVAVERPTVIFLRPANYRVLATGSGTLYRVLCASEDGKVPHSGVLHPKDVDCQMCSYSQWDRSAADEKPIPPPCQDGLALLGVLPEMGNAVCWMPCRGYKIIAAARAFCQDAMTTPGSTGYFRFRVTLSSKREETARGAVSYVPVFAADYRPEAEMALYREMALASVEMVYRINVRSEAAGPAPIDVTPGAPTRGPGTVPAAVIDDDTVPF
mgnify:CR=1 FL=1